MCENSNGREQLTKMTGVNMGMAAVVTATQVKFILLVPFGVLNCMLIKIPVYV
jgi:hypothetical protein